MARDSVYDPVEIIRDVVKQLVMDSISNKSSQSEAPYGSIALKTEPGCLFARMLKVADAKYNGVLMWRTENPVDEVTARVAQWFIDVSEEGKLKSVVPAFSLPKVPPKFVWWSWHPRYPSWSRSCWEADTKEEAIKFLSDPFVCGLDTYHNKLIKHEGDHWEEVMDVPCKKMEHWNCHEHTESDSFSRLGKVCPMCGGFGQIKAFSHESVTGYKNCPECCGGRYAADSTT